MWKKLAIILTSLGLLTILGVIGFQMFGDNVISEIRKTESKVIQAPEPATSVTKVAPEEPVTIRQYTIKIANKGGDREMNYCADGFTDMIHYEGLNGKQMLARHNNCGGDILLPIVEGDHVVIEGDQEYVVTELRDTTKHINTGAVNDMNGTVLLQTCYWKDNRMKFVALTPLTEYYK